MLKAETWPSGEHSSDQRVGNAAEIAERGCDEALQNLPVFRRAAGRTVLSSGEP